MWKKSLNVSPRLRHCLNNSFVSLYEMFHHRQPLWVPFQALIRDFYSLDHSNLDICLGKRVIYTFVQFYTLMRSLLWCFHSSIFATYCWLIRFPYGTDIGFPKSESKIFAEIVLINSERWEKTPNAFWIVIHFHSRTYSGKRWNGWNSNLLVFVDDLIKG